MTNYGKNEMLPTQPAPALRPDQNSAESEQQQDSEPSAVNKEQWTLSEDYVLIENYPKFRDLSKKQCFNYIAALLDSKEPKQCYDRYKLLDLKHLTPDEAKARADLWHSQNEARQLEAKINKATAKVDNIGPVLAYLQRILDEAIQFERAAEDALLFGRQVELMDMRHNPNVRMRVVPMTQQEHIILNNVGSQGLFQSLGLLKLTRNSFYSVDSVKILK